MKKISIKIISVLFCLIFIVSSLCSTAVATETPLSQSNYKGDIPVIFISGQGTPLMIPDENGVYTKTEFKLDFGKMFSDLTADPGVFLKAFVTQDWREFDDLIVKTISETFSSFVLDENGETKDGSYSWFGHEPWYKGTLTSIRNRLTYFDGSLDTFQFAYDWRLDPVENMDELEDYIGKVLSVTGETEYAICGRCEGACIALQYLEYYKEKHGCFDSRIKDIIFYASAANGISLLSDTFTGRIEIPADGVEKFIYDKDLNIDLPITDNLVITDNTVRKAITYMSDLYGLDLGVWAINNVYSQIYKNVVPRVLKNSYATWPGYWAMINIEDFEEAKKFVFGGEEEKYAKFIEKIDRYYNQIALHTDDIIQDALDNGVEISNVVKYGRQAAPSNADDTIISDTLCDVERASWGAATAKQDNPFDREYLLSASKNGTAAFISPDKVIDASTCKFPETTWFIKNLDHTDFPNGIDPLIFAIVNNKNFTVFSDKDFPQYMFYDGEKNEIKPYDPGTMKTNIDIYFETVANTFGKKIKPYFEWVFKALTFIINALMPKVKS